MYWLDYRLWIAEHDTGRAGDEQRQDLRRALTHHDFRVHPLLLEEPELLRVRDIGIDDGHDAVRHANAQPLGSLRLRARSMGEAQHGRHPQSRTPRDRHGGRLRRTAHLILADRHDPSPGRRREWRRGQC
jgi:hypothetical protein